MNFRLLKNELFDALGYKPHEGQLAVHLSKAPRRVLACGARFGKTTCATMEAVAAVLEPRERSLGWVVGPYQEIANRTFRRVVETIETHFSHRIRSYSPREHRLVVVNFGGGISEVCGRTADNKTSLLGVGLDWLIVDEASHLSKDVWTGFLSQRLIDRGGWSLLVSTPRGCNWFFKEFQRGQKSRDASYAAWQMPSWANPHIDRALIEAERPRLSPDEFRQEYEAHFAGIELEPCDTCGGPSADAVAIVVVHNKEKPGRCPECDGVVHPSGKTAVAVGVGGKLWTKTVILQDQAR